MAYLMHHARWKNEGYYLLQRQGERAVCEGQFALLKRSSPVCVVKCERWNRRLSRKS